ncbi:hypothetical protein L596_016826 [Steinernema carpocapsae]|nr:hypothetical protein L596_016826 [Steinernema carpocapsae]
MEPVIVHGKRVILLKRVLGTEYPVFNAGKAIRSKYVKTADESKGMKHFGAKVCEKVKAKQKTNYKEVADELVQEHVDGLWSTRMMSERKEKNIRRRVYDATNVLIAMNIIVKEKKELRWVGLPKTTAQKFQKIDEEKYKRLAPIKQKTEQLHDLINQLFAYKFLLERNRERERNEGRPADNTILYLHIIVNTNKKTLIDCAISHDKTEYLFNFDQPFEIHDEHRGAQALGLAFGLDRGEVTPEHREKIKSYLPEALRHFIDQFFDGSPLRRQTLPPPPVQDKKPL